MVLAASSPAILSALGSIGSSFMSNASSRSAQKRAFKYATALQQQQYDLGIRGYKESPTAQREGLVSAGYNPMLALGNVGSTPTVAGGTPVGANATDTSGISSAAFNATSLLNQSKQIEATVKNLEASARNQDAQATGQSIKNEYLNEREKAEIGNTDASTSKMNAEIKNMEAFQAFKEQELRLQQLGIDKQYNASIFGSQKAYESSIYNADTQERNNKRTNEINEVNNIRSNNTNRRYKFWQGYGFGHAGYY